jgi:hypothetical protein
LPDLTGIEPGVTRIVSDMVATAISPNRISIAGLGLPADFSGPMAKP